MINNNISASDFTNFLGLNFKVWRNRRKNLSAHKQQFSLPLLRALLFLLEFQMTHRKWNGFSYRGKSGVLGLEITKESFAFVTAEQQLHLLLMPFSQLQCDNSAAEAIQLVISAWNVRGGNGKRVALVSYLCPFGLGFNVMKFTNWMCQFHTETLLAWISFLTRSLTFHFC